MSAGELLLLSSTAVEQLTFVLTICSFRGLSAPPGAISDVQNAGVRELFGDVEDPFGQVEAGE